MRYSKCSLTLGGCLHLQQVFRHLRRRLWGTPGASIFMVQGRPHPVTEHASAQPTTAPVRLPDRLVSRSSRRIANVRVPFDQALEVQCSGFRSMTQG